MLVRRRKPVLLVGVAGTGKTTVLREYLESLDPMAMLTTTVNCNFYTNAMALQRQLEASVDKRSGKIYGPTAGKHMLYFIDDLNMAQVGAPLPSSLPEWNRCLCAATAWD